jgi:hypothetical protein
MGTLVAMHYPTVLAVGAADHTYVRCSTGGKAWSCWGDKTGGSFLRSGMGSTNQADAIAEPNERAGVTCYLVNGVCHQSANRILFPAGIFVTGARGYGVSLAIYGPYGRPTGALGACKAPFNHHTGTTGDLPACVASTLDSTAMGKTRSSKERRYFKNVSTAYGEVVPLRLQDKHRDGANLVEFMVHLFDYQIEYNLGDKLDKRRLDRLRKIRASAETSRIQIETDFAERKLKANEFVATSDLLAISFQKEVAGVTEPDEYEALFNLKYGEFIVLADPTIVTKAYPKMEL